MQTAGISVDFNRSWFETCSMRTKSILNQSAYVGGRMLSFGLVGAFCFVVGVVLGIYGGDMNTWIDFCADDTSGKYISDDAARATSCK